MVEICWHLAQIFYRLQLINPWKNTLLCHCFDFLNKTFYVKNLFLAKNSSEKCPKIGKIWARMLHFLPKWLNFHTFWSKQSIKEERFRCAFYFFLKLVLLCTFVNIWQSLLLSLKKWPPGWQKVGNYCETGHLSFLYLILEDYKLDLYWNFQLILPMRFHFMRYFVNSIIFRVSPRLQYCVFIEVDFEK